MNGEKAPGTTLAGRASQQQALRSENWLEHLLVSASMNGLRHYQQNPF
ncbi:MAG: hypothetical protein ACREYE_05355 [Gammaproteobacteria bacterium]